MLDHKLEMDLVKSHTKREIGLYPTQIKPDAPLLVVGAGIHGNEPSGVIALKKVFAELERLDVAMNGNLLGIAGNLMALRTGERYIDRDLNRIFLENGNSIESGQPYFIHEELERREIVQMIEKVENQKNGSKNLYFLDLHSTSSDSIPYISVNRKTSNTEFATKMKLPVVVGIEEFIPGHFDHFLTERGYVGFTVEGGQHLDPNSITTHINTIFHTMITLGMLNLKDVSASIFPMKELIPAIQKQKAIYEVVFRQDIQDVATFVMKSGFKNFTKIEKGELLAHSDGKPIISPFSGYIFMPLYQKAGKDGFYIVKKTEADNAS
ncbi:succinylglutamate desuccinylase/aspartoacylase family protein [Belliella marina]|uniref:Succinylglutamate desuccinylase/aspartoacylase family protein n=1 Tax=Belliella marina TaxID=1644146 RepID=A0ABW4VPV5_9BACT